MAGLRTPKSGGLGDSRPGRGWEESLTYPGANADCREGLQGDSASILKMLESGRRQGEGRAAQGKVSSALPAAQHGVC